MWTCPKCGEKIEDQFDTCWKCAAAGVQVGPDGIEEKASEEPAPAPPKEFEFGEEENKTISSLASSMAWFSAVMFVAGAIQILGSLVGGHGGAGGFVQGILAMVIGSLTHSSSKSFKAITTSEGSDISLLMEALTSLNLIYRIQLYLVLAAVIILALVLPIALLRR